MIKFIEYYLNNSLGPQTKAVEPDTEFQAPAPPSKAVLLNLFDVAVHFLQRL